MCKYLIKHRRGNAKRWEEKSNLIPEEGEMAVEIDEGETNYHKFKLGDGKHKYGELPYFKSSNEILEEIKTLAPSESENVTLGLNEPAPEDTVPSICDFELVPKTMEVGYNLTFQSFTQYGKFHGSEIPPLTTQGRLSVVDKNNNLKYSKYINPLFNYRDEVKDILTQNGIIKNWSKKFYLNKLPTTVEAVGMTGGLVQNYICTWEFEEEEFLNYGIPLRSANIPILSACFISNENYTNAAVWYATQNPAIFYYDNEANKYIFKAKTSSSLNSIAILTNYSKVYFYYQIQDSYNIPFDFAMGITKGDQIIFEPDFSDTQEFIDSGEVYQLGKGVEVNIDPTVTIQVPRNSKDACSGMINAARILNNAEASGGGDSTVQGYSWIGEGDGESDYTARIQSKLNELNSLSRGGTIHLGPGTSKISDSLIVYGNTTIQGTGLTTIEQISDNTHAIVLSGSNINLKDLTIKLSGECTEDTACIFANSDNHPTLGGHYNDKYPQNMYTQFCSALKVTLIGTYRVTAAGTEEATDSNGNTYTYTYYELDERNKNYRGYGFKGHGLYFNYFTCTNVTGRHLFSVVGGSSASRISVTATECNYGVYPGVSNSFVEITGHSYYATGKNKTMINASKALVYSSSVNTIYLARAFDTQHYEAVIYFDETSFGNTCMPVPELSQFSNISEIHPVSQDYNKIVINYGRGNTIPGYQETHPYFIGARYINMAGQTLINPQSHGSVDNALAGAGVWGKITSGEDDWNENASLIGLADICRYPKELDASKSRHGAPALISKRSPSVEHPIEITIDVSNRPISSFKNLWIQFHHEYVASDFSITFYNKSGALETRYFVNNREPIFYYAMHQEGGTGPKAKIVISITKAQQIENLKSQDTAHVVREKNYNPDGLIGIVNIGMAQNDAFGRAYLGECGGSLYGNVDMHQNTLKNLAEPKEEGDAVNKAYLDSKLEEIMALLNKE